MKLKNKSFTCKEKVACPHLLLLDSVLKNLDPNNPPFDVNDPASVQKYSDQLKTQIKAVSSLVGGTVALATNKDLSQKDLDIAQSLSDNVQENNSLFGLIPKLISGMIAAASYANAPKDEKDIKTGTTGSEYILLPLASTKFIEGGQYLGKQLLARELSTSTMAGIEAATIEVGTQVGTQTWQQMQDQGTYNPLNVDYSQINLDYTNILAVGLAGRLLSPSVLDTNKGSIYYSFKARSNLSTQKATAQSQSKVDKLSERINSHENNIIQNTLFQIYLQGGEKVLTKTFSDEDNK